MWKDKRARLLTLFSFFLKVVSSSYEFLTSSLRIYLPRHYVHSYPGARETSERKSLGLMGLSCICAQRWQLRTQHSSGMFWLPDKTAVEARRAKTAL